MKALFGRISNTLFDTIDYYWLNCLIVVIKYRIITYCELKNFLFALAKVFQSTLISLIILKAMRYNYQRHLGYLLNAKISIEVIDYYTKGAKLLCLAGIVFG